MENFQTLQSFTEGIAHYKNLFRVDPEVIACDLHPNYLSTRYALERSQKDGIPVYKIQHHHAHIASCMADNSLPGEDPVIGISFDGTGYGSDGAIWGGEFLIADYAGYRRFAHLEYTPLPGGDAATKNPYRIALAQLWHYGILWDEFLLPVQFACGDDLTLLHSMLENKINTPMTSSIGRLFDSVSALLGVCPVINYEAQAAIELENQADPHETGAYPIELNRSTVIKDPKSETIEPMILSVGNLIESIVADLHSGTNIQLIAARFHNSLVNAVLDVCRCARNSFGINKVALSGGVWQNVTLLQKAVQQLKMDHFTVYIHNKVPANDGGLALGQAVIAARNFQKS
jgi:hydrogenase maturation protein HypF